MIPNIPMNPYVLQPIPMPMLINNNNNNNLIIFKIIKIILGI